MTYCTAHFQTVSKITLKRERAYKTCITFVFLHLSRTENLEILFIHIKEKSAHITCYELYIYMRSEQINY